MRSSHEDGYDLFLSYRSEDIHAVRPVAEQLMANGLGVWFAEYEVLLEGRERFDRAILHGVSRSSYGLCFTNDRYSCSGHCRRELQLLLDHLGPGRIVEIRYPNEPLTHREFPDLRNARAFKYSDLAQAVRDIQSVAGSHFSPSPLEPPSPCDWHDFSSCGLRFCLDFGGWRVRKPLFSWLGGGDRRVAVYRGSAKGNALRGHLIAGPMDVCRGSLMAVQDDDRAYYDRALKFADSFYQLHSHQAPIGVHLSFTPGHISQAAFTTQYLPGVIARLYSVTLRAPQSETDLELAFFFFFDGTIHGFWRQAYLMDRVVHSLSIKSHSGAPILTRKRDDFAHAVLSGSLPRVRELLCRGADPNVAALVARGPKGGESRGTPLMAAASEGLAEIVAELLAHGARVNDTDTRGWTALLFAAENGYGTICKMLMDSGANCNVRTAQRGTALMVAALKGHADVVQLLLEYGADPSLRDSTGKSALDLAVKYGRSDVASILTMRPR